MSDRINIPYLVPDTTFVFEYEFDGAVTGTPTWELFVDGLSAGAAASGSLVGGNLWRFDVAVPSGATVGKSARVRITANVGGATFVDVYSGIAGPVKLIERDQSYRWTNNNSGIGFDDVTVGDVP